MSNSLPLLVSPLPRISAWHKRIPSLCRDADKWSAHSLRCGTGSVRFKCAKSRLMHRMIHSRAQTHSTGYDARYLFHSRIGHCCCRLAASYLPTCLTRRCDIRLAPQALILSSSQFLIRRNLPLERCSTSLTHVANFQGRSLLTHGLFIRNRY